jgi:hypothetical protein
MPLGKYKDFSACHAAKMREGLSAAAADRYCGKLQQQIEGGSSSKQNYAAAAPMSFPPQQKQEEKKPEEESAGVTLSKQKAETVVSALVNAKEAVGTQSPELAQQLDEAIAAFGEVANISE